jgi:hypothetical protein
MPLTEHERSELARLLRFRKLHWLSLALTFLAFVVSTLLAARFRWWLVYLVPVMLLFVYGYTGRRLDNFQCPRCSKPFFNHHGPLPRATAIPLQRKCGGCGLPIRGKAC